MIRSLCKYNYSDEDRFLCAKNSGRAGCTGCIEYDDGEKLTRDSRSTTQNNLENEGETECLK